MITKIDPKLEWLRPYLDDAKTWLNLDSLKRIYLFHASLRRERRVDGLVRPIKGNSFELGLYLQYTHAGKLSNFSTINVLEIFAHELGHLHLMSIDPDDDQHTIPHKQLELNIMKEFLDILENEGYTTEEEEEKLFKILK